MHIRRLKFACCIAALVFTVSGEVSAAKFNRVLDVGKQAPAWKALQGVDGKTHNLDDLKKAKAVVVVFTCNHCPVAQAYEKRMIKLASESRKQGVEFVAISVSRYEADNLEAMKKRSTERKYSFTYLQDPTQQIGKKYGALWTPSVFLLDSHRRVVYMGGVDDSMYPEKVQRQFLKDAIEAVLARKPVDIGETKPVGCPIEYE
ncbi:MAG: thioredoxin family protein [Planctomycetales bacterium]|jgi:peroxiredoxin